LNPQYDNGRLIVFVIKDKMTNEIHGIVDTIHTAQDHIKKLSNLGFTTTSLIIDAYRVIDK